jgi:hypothetical protein
MKKAIYVILALLVGYIIYEKILKDLVKKKGNDPMPAKVPEQVTTVNTGTKKLPKVPVKYIIKSDKTQKTGIE